MIIICDVKKCKYNYNNQCKRRQTVYIGKNRTCNEYEINKVDRIW